MNNQAREALWYVTKEDWKSHGYTHEHRDSRTGSELTNDIHSMFSYELDDLPHNSTTKARWGKLTTEEYELLDQPLRLATQWLESAPSCDAICSITDGGRYHPPENPIFRGIPVFEFRKHNLPLAVVRDRAGNVLKRLGRSIMFQATDRDPLMDIPAGNHGITSPVLPYHPSGIAITDRPERRGLASIVRIHPQYLATLDKVLNIGTVNTRFQVNKLHFEIALTICHEVIHALNFAIESDLLRSYIEMGYDFKPVPFNEPFHEGHRVAELGFFWENHVFGGVCNQSMPITENPIFIAEWPSWMLRDKKEQPERAPPRQTSFRWLVSIYYIKTSLSQQFWDTVRDRCPHDLLALRIRKSVGYKCTAEDENDSYDESPDPNALENDPRVAGSLVRVVWNGGDPSDCARLANKTINE